jgi:hypothetical protein
MSNQPHSPMPEALAKARRCAARTKSRQGQPCKAPAMPNGRCWVHGGPSTGPRTPEGLARARRARWKHGQRSAGAIAERKRLSALLALVLGRIQQARKTFKINESK